MLPFDCEFLLGRHDVHVTATRDDRHVRDLAGVVSLPVAELHAQQVVVERQCPVEIRYADRHVVEVDDVHTTPSSATSLYTRT